MKIKLIFLEVTRILLGVTLVVSGLLKGVDPKGLELKIHEFFSEVFLVKSPLLLGISSWLAYFLIVIEFCAGAFLLMGIYRRLSSRLVFILFAMFTLLTGYVYVTEAIADCGCFGDALSLTPWETFAKNLLLFPLSFWLMLYARKIKCLYSLRERWIPAFLAVCGIGYFVYANATTLPYVDFRPYKIGYNLKERIYQADSLYQKRLNEGTRYIYERNGKRVHFDLSNIPDSSWTYVGVFQPEELLHYKLEYSFVVLDSLGEDVSSSLLENPQGVVLLLSSGWETASQEKYESVNDLYLYLKKKGIEFYAVSPSDSSSVSRWRYETGAEYPTLTMDKSTIHTILRSNPGLLFLKSGRIIDKIPSVYFPKKEEIATFVTARLLYGEHIQPTQGRVVLLVVWGLLLLFGIIRLVYRFLSVRSYRGRR